MAETVVQNPGGALERYFHAPLRRLRAAGVTPFEVVTVVVMTVLVLWFVLAPVLNLFYGAFQSEPPGEGGVWTLDHFRVVFGNPGYWRTVGRTLLVGFGVVFLATIIGSPLAWLVVKTDMRGKRWVELSAILPFFTSTFVGALAWILLGNPPTGWSSSGRGFPSTCTPSGGSSGSRAYTWRLICFCSPRRRCARWTRRMRRPRSCRGRACSAP